MTAITTELANALLLDEKGESHELGSLVREKPAVLVFLRHFG